MILYILCILTLIVFPHEEKDPNLITPTSIGPIEICQAVESVQLKVLRDTTNSGDGFLFYGKCFGKAGSEILAKININDSSTITRLSTKSKAFKTKNGIHVGSSLNELIEANKDLQLQIIFSGYDDEYLFESLSDQRIEYRFGNQFNKLLRQYQLEDIPYSFIELDDMKTSLSQVGDSIFIEEISVAKTGNCDY